MEDNQIYSSMDDAQEDGTIFVVDIEENETSMRLRLKGEYSLKIADGGLFLLTLNTDQTLYYWPYTVLRRYGTSKTGFTFEAGRKSQAGPGVLRFVSPSGKLITRNIKETVNRIKGDIPTPNSDQPNLGSSINSNSFSEVMSGEYTEYSHTTGRPNRAKPRLTEPNRELSLEIPGQYMNSNRIAGGPQSNSVTIPSQTFNPPQPPRPESPYYNTSMISPYGVSQDRSAYNTVGKNAILVDSYSEISSLPSPQAPTSLNINQNVPIPSPRARTPNILQTNPFSNLSPTVPLPYHSIKRSNPMSLDTVHTNEMLHKSTSSPGSTFPTCVSPLPGTDSGEDSGEEIENQVFKKISQACISVNELTANLELTPAHNTESQDYVNLNRNLIKTASNPLEWSGTLEPVKSPDYMNVTRNVTKDDSDYYNVTREIFEEDRKRANTDTISPKRSFQLHGDEDFDFSLTAGPASFSGIQNLHIVEEDMVYGNVQYHPSSSKKLSEHLYMNAEPNPPLHSVREHSSTEELHKFAPNSASQTLPPSPTKSYLVASNSQPSTIMVKSRHTKDKPISSQYSFLQDILPSSPKVPHAYTPWKSMKSENKQ